MTVIIDQLVECFQGYEMSHLDTDRVSFVSERYLADNKLSPNRKSIALRGKKRPKETMCFYKNARALAKAAKEKSIEVKDRVVAVLFRDSDGTVTAGRGNWQNKRDSMIHGFRAEEFDLGVAMIPKPKSEAWLLCATKDNPYQHCSALENESGNDKAENPLKTQLSESLDGNSGSANLKELLHDRKIDVNRIDMPSFNAFKEDLKNAVNLANGADQ